MDVDYVVLGEYAIPIIVERHSTRRTRQYLLANIPERIVTKDKGDAIEFI